MARYLSVSDAARELGLSPSRVRALIDGGLAAEGGRPVAAAVGERRRSPARSGAARPAGGGAQRVGAVAGGHGGGAGGRVRSTRRRAGGYAKRRSTGAWWTSASAWSGARRHIACGVCPASFGDCARRRRWCSRAPEPPERSISSWSPPTRWTPTCAPATRWPPSAWIWSPIPTRGRRGWAWRSFSAWTAEPYRAPGNLSHLQRLANAAAATGLGALAQHPAPARLPRRRSNKPRTIQTARERRFGSSTPRRASVCDQAKGANFQPALARGAGPG